MKKTLFLTLAAACMLAPLPGTAATVYKTQSEAAASVTKDGYILVVYAKGWDRFSEPFCKEIIADPEIQAAAGDAALILAPFYQYAKPEEKQKQAEVWGSLEEPRSSSNETYPCILMYDQKGILYGRVQGTSFLKGTMAERAAEIKAKLEAKHKQEELMTQAGAASGVERAKLVGEACAIQGIERPSGWREIVKAADPNDESGMVRRLNLDYYGFSQKYCASQKDGGLELGTEETISEMEKFLKDPAYTPEQKQIFHAVIIGTMRRSGADASQLKGAVMEMKKLAPESHMGVTADQYIKLYASGDSKK
ncbi:MAG: hypothetical protein J6R92_01675 [Akkermansia sp.]|nr:hypothetical protein [Akkermansia sp.]